MLFANHKNESSGMFFARLAIRTPGGYIRDGTQGIRNMHATPRQKLFRDASNLAREHTERAIETIANVMDDWSAEDRDRLAAANALLDRAHGKPVNAVIQVPMNRQIAQQLAAMSDEELEDQMMAQPLPRLAQSREPIIEVDAEPDPLTL